MSHKAVTKDAPKSHMDFQPMLQLYSVFFNSRETKPVLKMTLAEACSCALKLSMFPSSDMKSHLNWLVAQ